MVHHELISKLISTLNGDAYEDAQKIAEAISQTCDRKLIDKANHLLDVL